MLMCLRSIDQMIALNTCYYLTPTPYYYLTFAALPAALQLIPTTLLVVLTIYKEELYPLEYDLAASIILLPKLISSAPICLWNHNPLIRSRANTPATRWQFKCEPDRPIMPIRLQSTDKILCQSAYGIWPHYWHYTATQTTLSLVPYYYSTFAALPVANWPLLLHLQLNIILYYVTVANWHLLLYLQHYNRLILLCLQ